MASDTTCPAALSPAPHDPRRSAHRTIHGFLYQAAQTALRWLELRDDELLFCESDEDFDVLGDDALRTGSRENYRQSTQVKAYETALGLHDSAVRETLSNFITTFVARSREGLKPTFVFVTTAPPRRRGEAARMLKAWRERQYLDQVASFVRELLQETPHETRAWMDATPSRWLGFISSVEWQFETPDLNQVLNTLASRLASEPNARHLPSLDLARRLLLEVQDVSRHPEPGDRCLDRARLRSLFAETTKSFDDSMRAPQNAKRLLAIEDARRLSERLVLGIRSRPDRITSTGQLLTAAFQTVPWNDRVHCSQLDQLMAWCDEQRTVNVRLLIGSGGSGKTRLAIELVRRMRLAGWQAGFLRDPPAQPQLDGESVDVLLRGSDPRLIVIDYAETRQGWLAHLLGIMSAVRGRDGVPPVRLLLLARSIGDWWQGLAAARPEIHDLVAAIVPDQLAPLTADHGTRAELFEQAVWTFATLLNKQSVIVNAESLNLNLDRILLLQMAALAFVEGNVVRGREEILSNTLEHEQRYWDRECQHFCNDGESAALSGNELSRRALRRAIPKAVVALTLTNGAINEAEAREYIFRVTRPEPGDIDIDLTSLIELLRRLYTATETSGPDSRFLVGLEPDLLGEYHVGKHLTQTAGVGEDRRHSYLDALFPEPVDPNVVHAFVLLGRAAVDDPKHQRWIRALLVDRAAHRAPIALLAALAVGSGTAHSPLGRVLAEVVAEQGNHALATVLYPAIPQDTVGLRELAACVATQLHISMGTDSQSIETDLVIAERARLATISCARMGDLGNREQALAAARDATLYYRRLATSQAATFEPLLASSLNDLSNALSEVGRSEEALTAVKEASVLSLRLAKARPGAFDVQLAISLNNLGSRLCDLGRAHEAETAIHWAIAFHRRHAQSVPGVFEPYVASSLINLARACSEFGRREEAVTAATEAVDLQRRLSRDRPDAFEPSLATALDTLGCVLGNVGRVTEALAAAREASALYHRLAASRPHAFKPNLAISLTNLGGALSNAGLHQEALTAARDATGLLRLLATGYPDRFRSLLAHSLNTFGKMSGAVGNREEAVAAANEATTIYRHLVVLHPGAFETYLATSLSNLGNALSADARHAEALHAAEESVAVYRQLNESRGSANAHFFAGALNNLGNRLGDMGRWREAVVPLHEAVERITKHIRHQKSGDRRLAMVIVGSYLNACKLAGSMPDAALLADTRTAFANPGGLK